MKTNKGGTAVAAVAAPTNPGAALNSAKPTAAPSEAVAAPGEAVAATEKKKQDRRDKRAVYAPPAGAAWADKDGKLIAVPEDYDVKKHQPLKRKHYADEGLYLTQLADRLERKVVVLRKSAEDLKKLGGVKDKGKAKKLLTMQRKMEELRKQLESDGVDVDAMLGSMRSAEVEVDGNRVNDEPIVAA